MPRVKRGTTHTKKRKKLLKTTKGYKWGRKSKVRLAKTAATKAGAYAFRDRRNKKRTTRRLWQVRLNAAVRERGSTYSKFMGLLKKSNVELNRKILSELALNEPKIFDKIFEQVIKK